VLTVVRPLRFAGGHGRAPRENFALAPPPVGRPGGCAQGNAWAAEVTLGAEARVALAGEGDCR